MPEGEAWVSRTPQLIYPEGVAYTKMRVNIKVQPLRAFCCICFTRDSALGAMPQRYLSGIQVVKSMIKKYKWVWIYNIFAIFAEIFDGT